MNRLDRASQFPSSLLERPLRAADGDHAERYAGHCCACGVLLELHFTGRHCTARNIGCGGARDVVDWLRGHGLALPSERAPEPGEPGTHGIPEATGQSGEFVLGRER